MGRFFYLGAAIVKPTINGGVRFFIDDARTETVGYLCVSLVELSGGGCVGS